MHIRKVLYFHRKRQKNSQIYFSAAVQKAAALFVSTYFYFFSQQSAKCSIKRAPVTKRVRALFLSTKQTNFPAASVAGDSPGCRSPPSDFDFAYQLKKSKSEELHMKEINLRDYYPFYMKDNIVEVPDEVADLLREYKLSGQPISCVHTGIRHIFLWTMTRMLNVMPLWSCLRRKIF